jgi:2-keto-3-deoxygluconate permease
MRYILEKIKQIPGGLLLIPMVISALINTFLPEWKELGEPLTSLLTGKGVMTLLAINLFSAGTQLDKKELPSLLKKGMFFVGGRILICIGAGILFSRIFGPAGILGVSVVAFVTAIASTNPAIFLSLSLSLDRKADSALIGPMVFMTLPVIPLLALSFSKGSSFDILGLLILLLPFVIGYILGNRSEVVKSRYSKGNLIVLPFWGISVGSNVNLMKAFISFDSGLVLVLLFYLVAFLPLLVFDRFINKSDGFIPTATSTVAAVALIIPPLAAETNSAFLPFVESAQNQLATAFLLTSLLTPFLTKKIFSPKS